jgi:hypothetical protein
VSTPVVTPPPTPPSPQPGEGKKSLAEVWAGPVLGFIGGIIVALIGLAGVILVSDGGASPRPPEITITNKDELSPTVSGPVTLKGNVKNLGPGQTVWSFDLPAGSSGVWAHDGPCPVDEEGNWTCPVFDLGDLDGADNGKDFKIFAAVLDDSDIPQQIDMRLDRYKDLYNPMKSPVPPAVAMDSVNTKKK